MHEKLSNLSSDIITIIQRIAYDMPKIFKLSWNSKFWF